LAETVSCCICFLSACVGQFTRRRDRTTNRSNLTKMQVPESKLGAEGVGRSIVHGSLRMSHSRFSSNSVMLHALHPTHSTQPRGPPKSLALSLVRGAPRKRSHRRMGQHPAVVLTRRETTYRHASPLSHIPSQYTFHLRNTSPALLGGRTCVAVRTDNCLIHRPCT
jgi:hypothetical protein